MDGMIYVVVKCLIGGWLHEWMYGWLGVWIGCLILGDLLGLWRGLIAPKPFLFVVLFIVLYTDVLVRWMVWWMYSLLSVMTINNNFSGFTVFLWLAAMIICTLARPCDGFLCMHGVYIRLNSSGRTAESTDRLMVSRLIWWFSRYFLLDLYCDDNLHSGETMWWILMHGVYIRLHRMDGRLNRRIDCGCVDWFYGFIDSW